jgi:multicomponent K+:H+ antiporter subunit G
MLEIVVCILLIIGALFVLLGSFALVKLPDFYTRLHGPTKATTLGLGGLVLASVLYFSVGQDKANVQPLLIAIFLFISAPITAHMLIKVALHQKLPMVDKTSNKNWQQQLVKGNEQEKDD